MTEREGFEKAFTLNGMRELCAVWHEDGQRYTVASAAQNGWVIWQAATQFERKACAELCEKEGEDGSGAAGEVWTDRCAKVIRDRGK